MQLFWKFSHVISGGILNMEIFHEEMYVQSKRPNWFRRTISHSKQNSQGYKILVWNLRLVEDLDLEKVKYRFCGKVFRTLTANISERIQDREMESTDGKYKVACCLSKHIINFDLRCLREVKGHAPKSKKFNNAKTVRDREFMSTDD